MPAVLAAVVLHAESINPSAMRMARDKIENFFTSSS
jgi:hypothetical protein